MDPVYVTAFAHGRTSRASIEDLLPDASPEVRDGEDRSMLRAEIEDVADVVALPGAWELLAAVPPPGVWDLVHHLVTSCDIQNGKPRPEPYRNPAATQNELECVESQLVLVASF